MKLNEKREFYMQLQSIQNYKKIRKLESLCLQHGKTTVYQHSRNVAYNSIMFAKKIEEKFHISFNYSNLLTGAFLHDLFLYDWHEKDKNHRLHGYTHPKTACKNAKVICDANEEVLKIIKSHMWPLTLRSIPTSKEALIVCLVDKAVATKETFKR